MKITFLFLFVVMLSWRVEATVQDAMCQRKLEVEDQIITASDYCAFLNAVAASDPHDLYDEKMETDLADACITRTGACGYYAYEVNPGRENVSVSFASADTVAEYCEWKGSSQQLEQKLGNKRGEQESIDPSLKSNQLTFSIVNPNSVLDQAGGPEAIAASSEIIDEILAAIFLTAGGTTAANRSSERSEVSRDRNVNTSDSHRTDALINEGSEKDSESISMTKGGMESEGILSRKLSRTLSLISQSSQQEGKNRYHSFSSTCSKASSADTQLPEEDEITVEEIKDCGYLLSSGQLATITEITEKPRSRIPFGKNNAYDNLLKELKQNNLQNLIDNNALKKGANNKATIAWLNSLRGLVEVYKSSLDAQDSTAESAPSKEKAKQVVACHLLKNGIDLAKFCINKNIGYSKDVGYSQIRFLPQRITDSEPLGKSGQCAAPERLKLKHHRDRVFKKVIFGKKIEGTSGESTGIPKDLNSANLEGRAVATYKLSQLLGLGDLVPMTEFAVHYDKANNQLLLGSSQLLIKGGEDVFEEKVVKIPQRDVDYLALNNNSTYKEWIVKRAIGGDSPYPTKEWKLHFESPLTEVFNEEGIPFLYERGEPLSEEKVLKLFQEGKLYFEKKRTDNVVGENVINFKDPTLQRELVWSQLLDLLTGQTDRNLGNFIFKKATDKEGAGWHVYLIDNDQSFGFKFGDLNKTTLYSFEKTPHMLKKMPRLIDAAAAQQILKITEAQVSEVLQGTGLTPEEIDATVGRLRDLQDYIEAIRDHPEGYSECRLVSEWNDETFEELIKDATGNYVARSIHDRRVLEERFAREAVEEVLADYHKMRTLSSEAQERFDGPYFPYLEKIALAKKAWNQRIESNNRLFEDAIKAWNQRGESRRNHPQYQEWRGNLNLATSKLLLLEALNPAHLSSSALHSLKEASPEKMKALCPGVMEKLSDEEKVWSDITEFHQHLEDDDNSLVGSDMEWAEVKGAEIEGHKLWVQAIQAECIVNDLLAENQLASPEALTALDKEKKAWADLIEFYEKSHKKIRDFIFHDLKKEWEARLEAAKTKKIIAEANSDYWRNPTDYPVLNFLDGTEEQIIAEANSDYWRNPADYPVLNFPNGIEEQSLFEKGAYRKICVAANLLQYNLKKEEKFVKKSIKRKALYGKQNIEEKDLLLKKVQQHDKLSNTLINNLVTICKAGRDAAPIALKKEWSKALEKEERTKAQHVANLLIVKVHQIGDHASAALKKLEEFCGATLAEEELRFPLRKEVFDKYCQKLEAWQKVRQVYEKNDVMRNDPFLLRVRRDEFFLAEKVLEIMGWKGDHSKLSDFIYHEMKKKMEGASEEEASSLYLETVEQYHKEIKNWDNIIKTANASWYPQGSSEEEKLRMLIEKASNEKNNATYQVYQILAERAEHFINLADRVAKKASAASTHEECISFLEKAISYSDKAKEAADEALTVSKELGNKKVAEAKVVEEAGNQKNRIASETLKYKCMQATSLLILACEQALVGFIDKPSILWEKVIESTLETEKSLNVCIDALKKGRKEASGLFKNNWEGCAKSAEKDKQNILMSALCNTVAWQKAVSALEEATSAIFNDIGIHTPESLTNARLQQVEAEQLWGDLIEKLKVGEAAVPRRFRKQFIDCIKQAKEKQQEAILQKKKTENQALRHEVFSAEHATTVAFENALAGLENESSALWRTVVENFSQAEGAWNNWVEATEKDKQEILERIFYATSFWKEASLALKETRDAIHSYSSQELKEIGIIKRVKTAVSIKQTQAEKLRDNLIEKLQIGAAVVDENFKQKLKVLAQKGKSRVDLLIGKILFEEACKISEIADSAEKKTRGLLDAEAITHFDDAIKKMFKTQESWEETIKFLEARRNTIVQEILNEWDNVLGRAKEKEVRATYRLHSCLIRKVSNDSDVIYNKIKNASLEELPSLREDAGMKYEEEKMYWNGLIESCRKGIKVVSFAYRADWNNQLPTIEKAKKNALEKREEKRNIAFSFLRLRGNVKQTQEVLKNAYERILATAGDTLLSEWRGVDEKFLAAEEAWNALAEALQSSKEETSEHLKKYWEEALQELENNKENLAYSVIASTSSWQAVERASLVGNSEAIRSWDTLIDILQTGKNGASDWFKEKLDIQIKAAEKEKDALFSR